MAGFGSHAIDEQEKFPAGSLITSKPAGKEDDFAALC
jgi:hypothetical protein